MKKTVLSIAVALVAGGMLAACSSKQNEAGDSETATVVEQEVVGEVVEMPAEGSPASDSVVATAQAVAVDSAQ